MNLIKLNLTPLIMRANGSKREALAEAAYDMAATLDWSEIARRYRALYSSLA